MRRMGINRSCTASDLVMDSVESIVNTKIICKHMATLWYLKLELYHTLLICTLVIVEQRCSPAITTNYHQFELTQAEQFRTYAERRQFGVSKRLRRGVPKLHSDKRLLHRVYLAMLVSVFWGALRCQLPTCLVPTANPKVSCGTFPIGITTLECWIGLESLGFEYYTCSEMSRPSLLLFWELVQVLLSPAGLFLRARSQNTCRNCEIDEFVLCRSCSGFWKSHAQRLTHRCALSACSCVCVLCHW